MGGRSPWSVGVGAGEAHREEIFLFLRVRNWKRKVSSLKEGKQQIGIFLIRDWIRNALESFIHSSCIRLYRPPVCTLGPLLDTKE